MEYKVVIGTTEYTEANIRSANIERPLFDELGIGNACEAIIKIVFRQKAEIPVMAQIKPYALINDQWEPLGVFYSDERSSTRSGIMTIIGYDSMLKADQVWVPEQSLEFPMTMQQASSVIATSMGIDLDERTS